MMKNYRDVKMGLLKKKEIKKEYEKLNIEFALIQKIIKSEILGLEMKIVIV